MGKIEDKLEITEEKISKVEKNSNEIMMKILIEFAEDSRKASKRFFKVCVFQFCVIVALFGTLILK